MKLTDPVAVSSGVIAREAGGETALVDLASGNSFRLDPIGSRIWQLLEEGSSLSEACEAILAEYEVSAAELERDILALIEQLAAHGLVTIG